MKKIGKLYLLLLIILCAACDDPYKGDTFSVYDVQPASTYLSSRPEDFSEWTSIMKYADLYNAINQATEHFTLFVPNNNAVKAFYEKKGVSSITELGQEYARALVQYHVIQDTINQETFLATEGELEKKTLSEDNLSISTEEGGMQAVYLNKEARILEFANTVSNGYVYMLESVMNPLTESVYEKLSSSGRPYGIFQEALEKTGWSEVVNQIYIEVENSYGQIVKQKTNFTLFAVTNETYQKDGINNFDDLVLKLGAGSDYTNAENALKQYVGSHILKVSYPLARLQKFDNGATSKVYDTAAEGCLIKISQSEGVFYINPDDEEKRTTFIDDNCDLKAKNGYIQEVASYMPIVDPTPEQVLFDVTDFTEIANWVPEHGDKDGIKYQVVQKDEYKSNIASLNCYKYQLNNPSGTFSKWYNIAYLISKDGSGWNNAQYGDLLMLNIGNAGWFSVQTPTLMKGKYKVTVQFGYATSMKFICAATNGSNGGQMKFTFDDKNEKVEKPYASYKDTGTLGVFKYTLYESIEFDKTTSHTFKVVMDDPAASTHADYRFYIDYILFEPIIED